jgi:plastocyanin
MIQRRMRRVLHLGRAHSWIAALIVGAIGLAGAPAALAANRIPVYKLVEGAKGSPAPYTPSVLHIPAGRTVALDITDHIGGCALVTVFPGLGPRGGSIRARVPVGQTRRILIRAPKPGRYRYHCSGDMYFGEIVAR